MSDYNQNASGRQQGRGRGGRRRGGPHGPSNNGSSNSTHRPGGGNGSGSLRPNRRPPEPTGFQKFLSIITFGLYKPTLVNFSKPTVPNTGKTQQQNRDSRPERAPRPEREKNREPRGDRGERENRPPRQQPATTEITHDRLYVGNLSFDASESDLFSLFNGSGRVKNAEVVVNNRTQRSKGFAFVTMQSVDEAKKAVADLNGKDFMGRQLVVGGAKPLAPRDEHSPSASEDPDAITRPAEDEEEANRLAV